MSIEPFGNPDGSRAAIEELVNGFVEFKSETVWGGLATRSSDRTARVLVGRKGSGKTVYLRRLQADAAKQPSLFATKIDQRPPDTETIIEFCQYFRAEVVREKWTAAWHAAILRSVVSQLLNDKNLRASVPNTIADSLRSDFKALLGSYRVPVTVFSQLGQIIADHRSANSLNNFFRDAAWAEIEGMVEEALANCPPICTYIDGVDEQFQTAPMYWLMCQLGLFYETMQLLRDGRFGGRLHIFISIRDLVLAKVLQSEHQTRYLREPHIRVLTWDRQAIREFLGAKVAMLDDQHFASVGPEGKTLTAWVGKDKIWNASREIEEPVEQYLLRHTRLLPRDIIVLGNTLGDELARYRARIESDGLDDLVRRAVKMVSASLGKEQLKICGNQIASDHMPADAGRLKYSYVYTGNQEYLHGITENLRQFIAEIGVDRFDQAKLNAHRRRAGDLLGNDADPYAVLWQNGLLGYSEGKGSEKRAIFYSEAEMSDFTLPPNKKEYVLHSCLIDAVGIKAVGKHPVVQ